MAVLLRSRFALRPCQSITLPYVSNFLSPLTLAVGSSRLQAQLLYGPFYITARK